MNNVINSIDATTYEKIDYFPTIHHYNDIARLGANARLMGVDAVGVDNAKVLEIGCGIGTSLLHQAQIYPNSQFVGFDLSQSQIDTANEIKAQTDVSNIEFIADSFVGFKYDKFKFDYIIAHGLYAWIPEEISNDLIKAMQENLSENGVIFINCNMYPGGYLRNFTRYPTLKSIKVEGWQAVPEKDVPAYRQGIEQQTKYYKNKYNQTDANPVKKKDDLLGNYKGDKKLYDIAAELMHHENEFTKRNNDTLILFDMLADGYHHINYPDMVKQLHDNDLDFLMSFDFRDDSHMDSPPEIIKYVESIQNHNDRNHMVMLLAGRSFSSFILTHKANTAKANINNEYIQQFHYMSMYKTDKRQHFKSLAEIADYIYGNDKFIFHHVVTDGNVEVFDKDVALFMLCSTAKLTPFERICTVAGNVIANHSGMSDSEKEKEKEQFKFRMAHKLLSLIVSYDMIIATDSPNCETIIQADPNYKPVVYSNLRAMMNLPVTTVYGSFHRSFNLSDFPIGKFFFQIMDGTRTIMEIQEMFFAEIEDEKYDDYIESNLELFGHSDVSDEFYMQLFNKAMGDMYYLGCLQKQEG